MLEKNFVDFQNPPLPPILSFLACVAYFSIWLTAAAEKSNDNRTSNNLFSLQEEEKEEEERRNSKMSSAKEIACSCDTCPDTSDCSINEQEDIGDVDVDIEVGGKRGVAWEKKNELRVVVDRGGIEYVILSVADFPFISVCVCVCVFLVCF